MQENIGYIGKLEKGDHIHITLNQYIIAGSSVQAWIVFVYADGVHMPLMMGDDMYEILAHLYESKDSCFQFGVRRLRELIYCEFSGDILSH